MLYILSYVGTCCHFSSRVKRLALLPLLPRRTLCETCAQAFIHGIENNPVAALAQELGLTLVPMDDCKLLNREGQPVPEAMDQ